MDDTSGRVLALRLGDAPPPRLDKALFQVVPEAEALSRSRIAALIAEGAVIRPDGSEADSGAERPVPGGAYEIELPAPVPTEALAEAIALDVVYEDAALIVVDKPAGMVVHPAPGAWSGTLVNALLHHCGDSLSGIGGAKRPGIVHRIDKETSGLLVVAKTDRAHQHLAAQFKAHSVERHYSAICHGHPDRADPRLSGLSAVGFEAGGILRITAPIDRHPGDRKKMAVRPRGRHAVTRARVVETLGGGAAALIDCWLETGRTHQIRVHMAHVGHPLLGDPVYGGRRSLSAEALAAGGKEVIAGFARQALHAATLGFIHPETGAALRFESPMPPDLVAVAGSFVAGR